MHGIAVVFDLTDEKSLDSVPKWLFDINSIVPEITPKVLFGNKTDLLTEGVPAGMKEKIERIVSENNLIYFQGSVKTGDKVE